VQENSKVIDEIVNTIVDKYTKELTEFMQYIDVQLKRKDELDDLQLERITLKIPLFMYFAATGLETLGIEGDTAKAARMDVYNAAFAEIAGTIEDKKKAAELRTMPEYFIEAAYERAYKKLKQQIAMAEHMFSATKKVLSKRMQDNELAGRDPGKVSKNRRLYHDED
jgi:hypothetical protein